MITDKDLNAIKAVLEIEIIAEGNGSHCNDESWLELKVKNLKNAIDRSLGKVASCIKDVEVKENE